MQPIKPIPKLHDSALPNDLAFIRDVLRSDPVRWHLLGVVAEFDLPDCWIAAGFVRNVVWDALHGRGSNPLQGDVDVIWFDPDCLSPEADRDYEEQLRLAVPSIDWSVKNQARMHLRNGDAPYQSAPDAMRYWPETATAVATRRTMARPWAGREFPAPRQNSSN